MEEEVEEEEEEEVEVERIEQQATETQPASAEPVPETSPQQVEETQLEQASEPGASSLPHELGTNLTLDEFEAKAKAIAHDALDKVKLRNGFTLSRPTLLTSVRMHALAGIICLQVRSGSAGRCRCWCQLGKADLRFHQWLGWLVLRRNHHKAGHARSRPEATGRFQGVQTALHILACNTMLITNISLFLSCRQAVSWCSCLVWGMQSTWWNNSNASCCRHMLAPTTHSHHLSRQVAVGPSHHTHQTPCAAHSFVKNPTRSMLWSGEAVHGTCPPCTHTSFCTADGIPRHHVRDGSARVFQCGGTGAAASHQGGLHVHHAAACHIACLLTPGADL